MGKVLTLLVLLLSVSFAEAREVNCKREVRRKNTEIDQLQDDVIFYMNRATAQIAARQFACAQNNLVEAINAHDDYSDADAELLALLEDECDLTEYTALKNRSRGRVKEGGNEAYDSLLRQQLGFVMKKALSLNQTCN